MIDNNQFHTIYLALGSNLGDRIGTIQQAYDHIEQRIGQVVHKSSFYETEPEGFESHNNFINVACEVQTLLNAEQVLAITEDIEYQMGRRIKSENRAYRDRIIDIDLLFFDSMLISTPKLIIPHPYLHQRKFVLEPLAQIAPNLMHPVLHKTVGQLNDQLQ